MCQESAGRSAWSLESYKQSVSVSLKAYTRLIHQEKIHLLENGLKVLKMAF